MGSPLLLLADEPTSALDAERSEAIVQLLAEVTREFGTATLMITHDLEQLALTQGSWRMVDGRLEE